MAINTGMGFKVGNAEPIDARLVLSKAQMLAVNPIAQPEKYFCVCSDDSLMYVYDVNNEDDPDTGKFRLLSGGNELPEYLINDSDKVLKVNAAGDGLEWGTPQGGVPTYTADDKEKVLSVNVDGTELVWSESGSGGAADWITNTALGNIPKDFDTTGKSALELLKLATVAYVNPTATVSWSQTNTLLKVGQTFNLTVEVSSITKGTSDVKKLELYQGDTLLQTIPYEAGTANYTFDLIEDIEDSVTFKVNVVDVKGKSTPYIKSYSFVNPYYWGSSNDIPTADTISSSTEMIESKGNKTLTHIAANQYVFIAYPKTYGVLNSILDSNNFENIDGFTKIEVSVNGVNYYCYYIGKLTVTGFKFTYKH